MKATIVPIVLLSCVLSCGGGGGTAGSANPNLLSGLAATGAGIQGTISLKDARNQERSVTTLDGGYSFDTTGLAPPFLLKAAWNGGELYSFAAGPTRTNINPLTHAIMLSASNGTDLASDYAAPDPALLAAIASGIPVAKAKLIAGLDPLLAQYAPGLDPMTGAFAANGTGMDQLLDNVRVSFAPSSVTVAGKSTGILLFNAPYADLSQGFSNESWSAAEARAAQDPAVAVDPSGQGLVLWSQTDGPISHIHAKWLCGSNPAATISTDLGNAAFPRVAFDAAGEAIAVWVQYDGGRNLIWSNRYLPASGWGAPVQLSTPAAPGDAFCPNLGVDAAGNAIAVWYQGAAVVTNHFDVYSSQFSAATGTWSAPAMRSNGSNSAYLPKVAVNGNGQGLVLWTQDLHDGSVSNDAMAVMGMSYAPGSGWGGEACLNSASGTTRAIYAQAAVAMDAAGNGMALWVQAGSSGPFDIWAAAWAAGAWRTAAPIADNVIDCCYAPELAFVSAGVAVATWNQQNTQTAYTAANLYANGAWATASMISDGTEDAYYPHIAVDACGNADVIWFQAGTADVTIRSNRFLAGSGWGTPQLIGVTGVTPLDFAGNYATPVSAIGSNAAGMSFTAWGIDPD